jgi:hypothetical protein
MEYWKIVVLHVIDSALEGIFVRFIFDIFSLNLYKTDIMENLVIENKGDQMILKLNKKGFDDNYLISLVKRLQIENLAKKSKFDSDILSVAEQINQDWWNKNGDKFLKGIKK